MKNIMILGICRTGKSTFSKMIQKKFNYYQIIEVDTIISALQKTIPSIPIGFIHDNLPENKLPQFLNLLIQKNINKSGNDYGFIINNCRKYDNKEEWTARRNDNKLIEHFTFYKSIEKKIILDCKKYGIKCIDMSHNRNKILNDLLDEITLQIDK